MEKENRVSLWIGYAASEEQLEEMLEFTYEEDGDSELPLFAQAFELDHFDDDFREALLLETPGQDWATALQDISYSELLLPEFTRLLPEPARLERDKVNAAVLLYHFDYKGTIRQANVGGQLWTYIGAVDCEML
ncbi:immunity 22 family protein [Paenibacillus wulumuqiensis]|uniref:immunity 22 family protein n=1 Tax=Paenibacillus wulumuqiensis TaxID=1567107 RepID=UPI000697307A|nr:immunity 22 family protein [Paenibacillus wulumuqiensis]